MGAWVDAWMDLWGMHEWGSIEFFLLSFTLFFHSLYHLPLFSCPLHSIHPPIYHPPTHPSPPIHHPPTHPHTHLFSQFLQALSGVGASVERHSLLLLQLPVPSLPLSPPQHQGVPCLEGVLDWVAWRGCLLGWLEGGDWVAWRG